MTNSEMFKMAHAATKLDRAFDSSNSYAYYFRLQLKVMQALKREETAELVTGFQVIEPRRVWG